MKNRYKILIMVLAVVMFIGIQSVHATPTLQLTSGISSVTVVDGGVGDSNPLAGAVTYIGSVGVFDLNVSTGVTSPHIGTLSLPQMDLNSANTTNKLNGGTLTIKFSETGFGPLAVGGFSSSVGGTTQGTVNFATYVDSSNTLFGTGTTLSSFGPFTGAFSASGSTAVTPLTPFSMTTVATLTQAKGQTSSFDLNIVPTPEPSTLLLLGSGLIGAAFYARRRKMK